MDVLPPPPGAHGHPGPVRRHRGHGARAQRAHRRALLRSPERRGQRPGRRLLLPGQAPGVGGPTPDPAARRGELQDGRPGGRQGHAPGPGRGRPRAAGPQLLRRDDGGVSRAPGSRRPRGRAADDTRPRTSRRPRRLPAALRDGPGPGPRGPRAAGRGRGDPRGVPGLRAPDGRRSRGPVERGRRGRRAVLRRPVRDVPERARARRAGGLEEGRGQPLLAARGLLPPRRRPGRGGHAHGRAGATHGARSSLGRPLHPSARRSEGARACSSRRGAGWAPRCPRGRPAPTSWSSPAGRRTASWTDASRASRLASWPRRAAASPSSRRRPRSSPRPRSATRRPCAWPRRESRSSATSADAQDIEWAIDDEDQLFILQARPLRTEKAEAIGPRSRRRRTAAAVRWEPGLAGPGGRTRARGEDGAGRGGGPGRRPAGRPPAPPRLRASASARLRNRGRARDGDGTRGLHPARVPGAEPVRRGGRPGEAGPRPGGQPRRGRTKGLRGRPLARAARAPPGHAARTADGGAARGAGRAADQAERRRLHGHVGVPVAARCDPLRPRDGASRRCSTSGIGCSTPRSEGSRGSTALPRSTSTSSTWAAGSSPEAASEAERDRRRGRLDPVPAGSGAA